VACPVSCANTGIASENATTSVNSIAKSFFMLGLDLRYEFLSFVVLARLGPNWHISIR
jgi:hypothetical protein